MGPFRWGIAGFGWVSRAFVAPAMASVGHRLVAVADPDPTARAAARAGGVDAHDALPSLLDAGGIDALYVATPNHLHRHAVETALAAGVPTLCEKPMAATEIDAAAIAAAARASTVPFRTAFDQRHHPAHAAMRDAVRAGRVGTVTAIRIVYACWLGPDWTPPVAGGVAGGNWRVDRGRAGGGAAIDLAPHGIDLASFLLDEPVVALTALLQRRVHDYDVDDGALLSGLTASGVLLSLHVAFNHPDGLPRRRLEIVGTAGMLVARDTMGQEPGGAVLLLPADGGDATPLRFDNDASPFARQLAAFAARVGAAVGVDADIDADEVGRDLDHHLLLHRACEEARCR